MIIISLMLMMLIMTLMIMMMVLLLMMMLMMKLWYIRSGINFELSETYTVYITLRQLWMIRRNMSHTCNKYTFSVIYGPTVPSCRYFRPSQNLVCYIAPKLFELGSWNFDKCFVSILWFCLSVESAIGLDIVIKIGNFLLVSRMMMVVVVVFTIPTFY